MQLNLPFKFNEETMNISSLQYETYPYIVSTSGAKTMSIEEIIMRLEVAYEEKDWDAVDLLLQDLRASEEEIDQWSMTWDD